MEKAFNLKKKLLMVCFISVLLMVNLFFQVSFVDGTKMSPLIAGWWLSNLIILVYYTISSLSFVFFVVNKHNYKNTIRFLMADLLVKLSAIVFVTIFITVDSFLDINTAYVILAILVVVNIMLTALFWLCGIRKQIESTEIEPIEEKEKSTEIECSKEEYENVVFCFGFALLASIGITFSALFIGLESSVAIVFGTSISAFIELLFIHLYYSKGLMKSKIFDMEERSHFAVSRVLKLSVSIQFVFVVLCFFANMLIVIFQSDFTRLIAFATMLIGVIVSLFCSLGPLSKLASRMKIYLDNEKK